MAYKELVCDMEVSVNISNTFRGSSNDDGWKIGVKIHAVCIMVDAKITHTICLEELLFKTCDSCICRYN
jgi:hypothetical protein